MKSIVLLLFLTLSLTSVAQRIDAFKVSLDILKADGLEVPVLENTTTIPFVTGEEGQLLRVSVTPPDDEIYTYYTVSYLPGKPEVLEGYDESRQSVGINAGYVSETEMLRGGGVTYFFLHEGDPLGKYRIEIYINGQLSRTFIFNVVEKEESGG